MSTKTMSTKTMPRIAVTCGLLVAVTYLTVPAAGQDTGKKAPANPWDRQVFFGEEHLHSSASPDAFAFGTPPSPEEVANDRVINATPAVRRRDRHQSHGHQLSRNSK